MAANENKSADRCEQSTSTAFREEHSKVIPVIQEEVTIKKELVETGAVTLTKHITTETVDVELGRSDNLFEIERRQVSELLDELPEPSYMEDGKTVYRLVREVPVVVKKFEVYEEIVVSKSSTSSTETVQVELRKEHITVDEHSNEG